jgi:Zn-dependent protease
MRLKYIQVYITNMITILSIIILVFSIIVHEVAHGFMADWLGDPTARLQGRLTLNPIKHIDPVGSIIVPLITSLSGFTFGWAKPVIYNPYNLKNKRQGEFLIALAGPASNLVIAAIFGFIIRLNFTSALEMTPFLEICSYIVVINLVLAIFNLIPIPPLDGSKLLFAWLPNQYGKVRLMLEMYAPIFILIVVFFLWGIISPIVSYAFSLFTGIGM